MTYKEAIIKWARARLEAAGIETNEVYAADVMFSEDGEGEIVGYIEYAADDPLEGEFTIEALPLVMFIRQLSEIGFR